MNNWGALHSWIICWRYSDCTTATLSQLDLRQQRSASAQLLFHDSIGHLFDIIGGVDMNVRLVDVCCSFHFAPWSSEDGSFPVQRQRREIQTQFKRIADRTRPQSTKVLLLHGSFDLSLCIALGCTIDDLSTSDSDSDSDSDRVNRWSMIESMEGGMKRQSKFWKIIVVRIRKLCSKQRYLIDVLGILSIGLACRKWMHSFSFWPLVDTAIEAEAIDFFPILLNTMPTNYSTIFYYNLYIIIDLRDNPYTLGYSRSLFDPKSHTSKARLPLHLHRTSTWNEVTNIKQNWF